MKTYIVWYREFKRSRRQEIKYIHADNLADAKQKARRLIEALCPLGSLTFVWRVC